MDKEMAIRLLNLISLMDSLNSRIKHLSDGETTFFDSDECKESVNILSKVAFASLMEGKKGD